MLWNTDLSKFTFITSDGDHEGARKQVLKATDLCHLFCVGDLESKTTIEQHPVLSSQHVKAVAEFVNKEIVAFQ